MVAKLQCTIKTHKPAGSLAARPLPAATGLLTNGMSAAVGRIFGGRIKDMSFLARSTDDVQRLIGSTRVPGDATMLKADIKDFYLAGDHADIIATATDWSRLPDDHDLHSEHSSVKEALPYLLYYQYVGDTDDDQTLVRVVCGTGMGAPCSGNITYFFLWMRFEQSIVGNWHTRQPLGILLYIRYLDDIFMFAETGCANSILSHIRHACQPMYEVELDCSSDVEVSRLDLMISKSQPSPTSGLCSLIHRPFTKPTARHVRLKHLSNHPVAVHLAWPLVEVRRMAMRYSRREGFENARKQMLDRFEHFGLHSVVLAKCRSWTPFKLRACSR